MLEFVDWRWMHNAQYNYDNTALILILQKARFCILGAQCLPPRHQRCSFVYHQDSEPGKDARLLRILCPKVEVVLLLILHHNLGFRIMLNAAGHPVCSQCLCAEFHSYESSRSSGIAPKSLSRRLKYDYHSVMYVHV